MSLLDTLTTTAIDSVTGLPEHLQDTEKLGQIGLSPENYNVISAMNAADNMNSGITGLMAPAALYSMGDTMFNSNQSIPEGINDFGRYMKGVNIQSNPELAKQLMGQNYVNQMQGKYALAMDQIGKGIFGKGPNPDLYNQNSSTPQNLGFIEEAPQVKEAIYQDRIMNSNLPGFMVEPSRFQGFKNKIGSGLGSIKDFAMNKGTQGFNLGKMALSGIGNAIMPGLGFVLSNLKPEPLFRETLANSKKANPLATRGFETIDGTRTSIDGVSDFGGFTTDDLGRITNNGLNYNTPEGIMSGYNSGFDLAGAALGRIGTIQNAIAKGRFKDKFALDRANKKIDNLKTAAVASAQAKRQAYQDKIDRAKNEAAANRARAKSITAGYGGHDDRPGATGPTATGAGMGVGGGYASDYGFLKDGGSVGLASMFTRRG